MLLRFSAASDRGHVRTHNEDSYLVLPLAQGAFLAVADGIGGMKGGEVASRIATRTLAEVFRAVRDAHARADVLAAGLVKANEAILAAKAGAEDPASEMGTTLTCLWIEREAAFAHVGDSRLYLLRGGEMKQITRDHSLVEELIRQGQVEEGAARGHPQRHVLMRALGLDEAPRADIGVVDVRAGDIFLLCTDGLTDVLDDKAVREILKDDVESAASRLVGAAAAATAADDVTAVVCAVEEADVREVVGA